MARYYFDWRDSEGLVIDDAGVELPDLEAAHEVAVASICDEVQDLLRRPVRETQIAIEVRHEGRSLLRVRFAVEMERAGDGDGSRN
jgi:hypothetical protein